MKKIEVLVLKLVRAGEITQDQGHALIAAVMFADDHCVSFKKPYGQRAVGEIQNLNNE